MRIVLIGATGTIGRAVAQALSARHELVRVARTSGDRHLSDTLDYARYTNVYLQEGYPQSGDHALTDMEERP
jgi:uncharacterized protein YbjT (DUF2867 family)